MKTINVTLTDEQRYSLVEEMLKSFEKQSKTGFSKGVFEFKCEVNKPKTAKVNLTISKLALDKIYALVDGFDSEVAWYMQCTKGNNGYTVHDVYVYPQKVSAVYVEMDMDKYTQWDLSLPDDVTFNGQGHSHHTMAVSPSSTDKDSQKSYVGYLNGRGFYIFCIVNRKRDENWWIYDLDDGVVFEPEDIKVIHDSGYGDFVEEAKKIVGRITPTYTAKTDNQKKTGGVYYDSYGYQYGGYYDSYYSKKKNKKSWSDPVDFESYQRSLDAGLECILYD